MDPKTLAALAADDRRLDVYVMMGHVVRWPGWNGKTQTQRNATDATNSWCLITSASPGIFRHPGQNGSGSGANAAALADAEGLWLASAAGRNARLMYLPFWPSLIHALIQNFLPLMVQSPR